MSVVAPAHLSLFDEIELVGHGHEFGHLNRDPTVGNLPPDPVGRRLRAEADLRIVGGGPMGREGLQNLRVFCIDPLFDAMGSEGDRDSERELQFPVWSGWTLVESFVICLV